MERNVTNLWSLWNKQHKSGHDWWNSRFSVFIVIEQTEQITITLYMWRCNKTVKQVEVFLKFLDSQNCFFWFKATKQIERYGFVLLTHVQTLRDKAF